MKKLKLAALNLGVSDILSRNQLKNILGGLDGSGDGSGGFSSCSVDCGGSIGTKTKDCGYGKTCLTREKEVSCDNGKNYTNICV